MLDKHVRILNLGDFILYRNNPEMNRTFMNDGIPGFFYKEVFKSIGIVGFGERGVICFVYNSFNLLQYVNLEFFDNIYPQNDRFESQM